MSQYVIQYVTKKKERKKRKKQFTYVVCTKYFVYNQTTALLHLEGTTKIISLFLSFCHIVMSYGLCQKYMDTLYIKIQYDITI